MLSIAGQDHKNKEEEEGGTVYNSGKIRDFDRQRW
jgi:hypothetical protein